MSAILLGNFTCTHLQIHNTNATYFGIDASEGWVIFIHFKIDFRGSDRESPTSYSDRGNKLGRGAQNNRAYNKEIDFIFTGGKSSLWQILMYLYTTIHTLNNLWHFFRTRLWYFQACLFESSFVDLDTMVKHTVVIMRVVRNKS